ncbi:nicotinate-nucleotide adenylyltransferase [Natribacillus halophilus]|uniref:Probable nicotinate-nucleotide adenylyltransferase n=1 Tax=Natribacillus halophilus TaxID=549003 RepID=A0A1G8JUP2_9BACI|nr:nicotinate-nucleotide adenylyltransferase [Natribacillus halophilus]SDI34845.1 nicotinate-nucleotide adenylyltransferase [Natribacillus halophilus]
MGRKIGILGGTFDPPHLAHLLIAQESMDACQLDEVWFIPTSTPPHKQNEDMATADDRVEMTRLAIADKVTFQLCTLELNRKGPSYTLDTIDILQQKYPGYEFYFIVGGDMAASLHTWNKIDELRKRLTFVVTSRPHYSLETPFEDELVKVDVPEMEISSSDIRERVHKQESIRYLVPEAVRAYIEENRLYVS